MIELIDNQIEDIFKVKDFKDKENKKEGYFLELWYEERFTECGFSTPKKNFFTSNLGLSFLFMNKNCIFDKRLLFAGEHTAFGFVGFMEGALLSGARAAKELVNRTKN